MKDGTSEDPRMVRISKNPMDFDDLCGFHESSFSCGNLVVRKVDGGGRSRMIPLPEGGITMPPAGAPLS